MTVPTIIDQLIALDKELFLFLNGLHTPWLDPMMRLVTETLFLVTFLYFSVVSYCEGAQDNEPGHFTGDHPHHSAFRSNHQLI